MARAQDPFPEGPGKDHRSDMWDVPSIRAWRIRAVDARGLAERDGEDGVAGAKGTDEELAAVLDYMATHFEGDAPKPVT